MAKPPPRRLSPPVFFVSDAHLGAPYILDPRRQELQLHQLLEQVCNHGRTFVLAGDLFDFWFEWQEVVPKRCFAVLYHLRQLVDHGLEVHYLSGNHDFRLHGFLECEIGLQVHPEAMCAQVGERNVYVFHGDGILTRDRGYRVMKRVLRSPLAQRAFALLHPDLAMRLARATSRRSRAANRIHPGDDLEYLAFARQKFAAGFDDVVLGHTHRPLEHCENGHTYVNLGDWITHYSYAVHDGQRLALQRWHAAPQANDA